MMRVRFLIITLFLCCVPFFCHAKDYDWYVDASAPSGGDGSKANPFQKISDALDEAEKSDSIFLMKGEYSENVTLNNAVELYGESENNSVIIGDVFLGNSTRLDTLTVTGKKDPVVVDGDASVEISNCTIRNFEGVGITLNPGKGKVRVANSSIKNGDGKAMYIQKGKSVVIVSNQITGNGEEGLDIRSDVSGEIRNNVIEKNKESGIEVLGGKADLVIYGNKIKNNGASGIAVQYYPDLGGNGKIIISGNTIGGNDKYGIDCNIPQGRGSKLIGFWERVIDLRENDIGSNKMSEISDFCALLKEEEEKDEGEEEKENEDDKKDVLIEEKSEIAEKERLKAEMIQEKKRKEKEKKLKEVEMMKNKLEREESIVRSARDEVNSIMKRSSFSLFVFGVSDVELENLSLILKNSKTQFETIQSKLDDLGSSESEKKVFLEEIKSNQESIGEQLKFLENQKKSFSIATWIQNIFG